jgi:hypothetical protein
MESIYPFFLCLIFLNNEMLIHRRKQEIFIFIFQIIFVNFHRRRLWSMVHSTVMTLQQLKRTAEDLLAQPNLPSDVSNALVSLPGQIQIAISRANDISGILSYISSLTAQYTPVFESAISSQARLHFEAGLSVETLYHDVIALEF